nr:P-loop NTPase fold protein [uncultured Celeribacter sp.]
MNGSRLTVPEPEIKLYEQGFEAASDLGRAPEGKKLSDLVEKIEEPMVIAVDAPWGAGKSVFLKCWVGEHIKEEHGNEATTVYFDAFQHDFLDDPLIALTGVISERFTKNEKHSKIWGKLKKAAYKLRKPAVRLGAFAASSGISEIAVPVVDALADAAAKELAKASDEFWKKEDGKRAAMQSFRDALESLAAEQKLVIVVDELDRCRPDYALNLLEVIKHFFNVQNVHFVLGVNLTELENSVRARYGARVNAGLYLQKFVTVTMRLLDHQIIPSFKKTYFGKLCQSFGVKGDGPFHIASTYLDLASDSSSTTLRGLQHFTRSLMISPSCWDEWGDTKIKGNKEMLRVGLLFLNAFHPQLISRLKQKQLTYEDVAKVLHLPDPRDANGSKEQTSIAWMLCFQSHADLEFLREYYQSDTNTMLGSFDYSTLIYLWDNYASVFQLTR